MPTRSDAGPALAAGDLALCRSILWEALALGFRRPTGETLERLVASAQVEALADAAAIVDAAGDTALAPLVRRLAPAEAPSLAALDLAHGRLFGHTARGQVPPYETEYGEDSLWQPQREMADLGAFFRAFGLALDPAARERPDHVACECEFLLALARREARAEALGDAGGREATVRAARLFLRDHLGRWGPAFGAALERADPDGLHGALGRVLAALVAAECRRLGAACGPAFLRLRTAAADDTPIGCGTAAGAPGA
jgi:TorA maturation chaperone TorD